jgi:hypothetical protein
MAEGERIDKGPSCTWPITMQKDGKSSTRHCGSEERLFNVKGRGGYTGRPRETPVCDKHLPEAWKRWKVEEAQPICGSKEITTLSGAAPHLPLAGGES